MEKEARGVHGIKDSVKSISERNKNFKEIILDNHKCAECGYTAKEIKIQLASNPDYSRVSKLHPNWNFSNGDLGYIICPKCKTRNDIFISKEITYDNIK